MSDDSEFLFGPAPHKEAMAFIANKPAVSREVFNGLLPELRARAFLVTGLESASLLQKVRDRIAEMPAGADWGAVKKDVAAEISPFIIDPKADPDKKAGQIAAANRRAELLIRTHGFQAYQAASYQVMDRQRDVLPFWQYLSMEDERVRPSHAALDKIVLPQDHPFWRLHYPPWDFGCRCQVVAISREDRDDLAALDKKKPPTLQCVLEGPAADQLTHGRIVRQLSPKVNPATYDVRAPQQKEGGSAYGWHPGELRIPLDQLKKNYDPAVWAEFQEWARKTPLEDEGVKTSLFGRLLGRRATLWDWLNGAILEKPPVPAPKLRKKREV